MDNPEKMVRMGYESGFLDALLWVTANQEDVSRFRDDTSAPIDLARNAGMLMSMSGPAHKDPAAIRRLAALPLRALDTKEMD
jgi:hypothetical protein